MTSEYDEESGWILVTKKKRQPKKANTELDLNNNAWDLSWDLSWEQEPMLKLVPPKLANLPGFAPVVCSRKRGPKPMPECVLCNVEYGSLRKYYDHIRNDRHKRRAWQMWKLPKPNSMEFLIVDFKSGYQAQSANTLIEVIQKSMNMDKTFYAAAVFEERNVMVLLLEMDTVERILSSPESVTYPFSSEVIKFRKRPVPKKPYIKKQEPKIHASLLGTMVVTHLWEISDVDAELTELVSYIQVRDLDTRLSICQEMEKIFSKRFAPCQVTPFGSSFSGLGFRRCDLDMYIRFDPENDLDCPLKKLLEDGYCTDQASMVKEAAKVLRKYGSHLVAWVKPIPRAKVPIVKMTHRKTGIPMDIMFKNDLGVSNTIFLAQIVSADTRIREYMVGLRLWAKLHCIAGGGSCEKITNYSFSLLMIFYLQQASILPPVRSLQERLTQDEERYIAGWNCGYKADFRQILEPYLQGSRSSAADLLKGFLEFYKTFDFEANVISPYLGKAVPRSDFQEGAAASALHLDMPLYLENTKAGEPLLDTNSWICLQDPFELNRNVTGGLMEYSAKKFSTVCAAGWQVFCEEDGSIKKFLTPERSSLEYEQFFAYSMPQL